MSYFLLLGSNGFHIWYSAPRAIEQIIILFSYQLNSTAIWSIFEVNWLNWHRCLAGSSKTAPGFWIFQLPFEKFNWDLCPPIFLDKKSHGNTVKLVISENIWPHCAQGRVPLTLGPGAYLIDAGGGGSSRDRTSFEDVLPQVLSGP